MAGYDACLQRFYLDCDPWSENGLSCFHPKMGWAYFSVDEAYNLLKTWPLKLLNILLSLLLESQRKSKSLGKILVCFS